MRRRRELLLLAVTVGLLWVITLWPLVVDVIQVVRTPPPQHPELVVIGIIGDAFERLLWIVGAAAVVFAVRMVARMIRPRLTGKSSRVRDHPFCQERRTEGRMF